MRSAFIVISIKQKNNRTYNLIIKCWCFKIKNKMSKKSISIVSYITIIGWAIAFLLYKNGCRSVLVRYHLKQSFGLGVFEAVFSMLFMATYPIISTILTLYTISGIVLFVILISGIINAINKKTKPVVLIGSMFVGRFNFI